MSLRRRLALILSAIVGAFVIITIAINFALADSILRESVDQRLRDQAVALRSQIPGPAGPVGAPGGALDLDTAAPLGTTANDLGATDRDASGRPTDRDAGRHDRGRGNGPPSDLVRGLAERNRIGGFQLIFNDGTSIGRDIPIDEAVVAQVRESGRRQLSDQTDEDGSPLRVLTDQLEDGFIVQLAADNSSLDRGLSSLGRGLLLSGLTGVLAAGLLGWFVASRFTKPITLVTEAAGQLARQQDLPSRIAVQRDDEIGELADSFNQMLTALEVSREQQTRLVADASHELRTPLTSLRMKIEFMQSQPDLAEDTRQQIVSGAAVELESLSDLVTELVDLASNSSIDEQPAPTRLGPLVKQAAEAARLTTGRPITVTTSDTTTPIRPRMVRRALSNLIDNANKYSPAGQPIEISEHGGRIEVRDHGPGIAKKDQPFAFDRFFRSDGARTKPGSGIGLAIVKRAAEVHGGDVWVRSAPDGGAIVGFSVDTASTGGNS